MEKTELFKDIDKGNYKNIFKHLKNGIDPNLTHEYGFGVFEYAVSNLDSYNRDPEENREIGELLLEFIKNKVKINATLLTETMFDGRFPIDIVEDAFKLSKKKIAKKFKPYFIVHMSSRALKVGANYAISLLELYEKLSNPLNAEELGILLADSLFDTQSGIGSCSAGKKQAKNHIPLIEYLLNRKADVNVKSLSGHTPLMRAAMNELPEACELLIQHGADVNLISDKGFTALMFVSGKIYSTHLWEPREEQLQVAKILLKSKANINIKANNKRTALSYAKASKNECILTLLES